MEQPTRRLSTRMVCGDGPGIEVGSNRLFGLGAERRPGREKHAVSGWGGRRTGAG
jgi:hypothetical protein